MNKYKNPGWWTQDHETAWDRVKLAMKRDWDQTKHDMGGKEPDLHQSIGNTTRQAAGKEAIPPSGAEAYEEVEPAYRFGYAARAKYGSDYPEWDDDLEMRLAKDWRATEPARKQTWMQDRAAIRYAWDWQHDLNEDYEEEINLK